MANSNLDISIGYQVKGTQIQPDGSILIEKVIATGGVIRPEKTYDNGGGRLAPHQEKFFTSILGVTEVSVFRQRDLKRDKVKYKVYYNERDGDRKELAFNVSLEELDLTGSYQEWYVVGRVIQAIIDSR